MPALQVEQRRPLGPLPRSCAWNSEGQFPRTVTASRGNRLCSSAQELPPALCSLFRLTQERPSAGALTTPQVSGGADYLLFPRAGGRARDMHETGRTKSPPAVRCTANRPSLLPVHLLHSARCAAWACFPNKLSESRPCGRIPIQAPLPFCVCRGQGKRLLPSCVPTESRHLQQCAQ